MTESAVAKSLVFRNSSKAIDLKACPLVNANNDEKSVELARSWESLPAKLLVAKRAHLIVDGDNFYAESLQDFLNPKAKIKECINKSSEIKTKLRFSVLAPTVIDLTTEKKTGSTVWNFQLFLDQQKLSTWNAISRASEQNFDLAKVFKEQGFQEKYFRLRGNEYEVVATKEQNGKMITISVVLESVEN